MHIDILNCVIWERRSSRRHKFIICYREITKYNGLLSSKSKDRIRNSKQEIMRIPCQVQEDEETIGYGQAGQGGPDVIRKLH
jgi:hypothetical protein